MPSPETTNPFDKDRLQTTVEQELIALGWVEDISAEIRVRVSDMIDRFLKEREFNRLKTNEADLELLLDRACMSVANSVYHQPSIKQSALEKIGIDKPQQEGLPESLYPAVYIQLFEQSGISVLKFLRQSFSNLERQGQKGGKKDLLDGLKIQLEEAKLPTALQDSLLESLNKFLSRNTGKIRLGELLFSEDPVKLEAWKKVFPPQKKADRMKLEAEASPTPESAAEVFITGKFRYFAGNPISTPGIISAMRAAAKMLVGESQINFLKVEAKGGAFLIIVQGSHNVDLDRLKQFKNLLEVKWKKKHPRGEALEINLESNYNGGSEGAYIDI